MSNSGSFIVDLIVRFFKELNHFFNLAQMNPPVTETATIIQ